MFLTRKVLDQSAWQLKRSIKMEFTSLEAAFIYTYITANDMLDIFTQFALSLNTSSSI